MTSQSHSEIKQEQNCTTSSNMLNSNLYSDLTLSHLILDIKVNTGLENNT